MEIKIYKDDKGRFHEEYYDEGKKVRTITVIDHGVYSWQLPFRRRIECYDREGKLLKREIEASDKEVYFLNGILGNLFGKAISISTSPDREKTNMRLRKILKNKSLSFDEKRNQRRIVVAEYRRTTHTTASNKKVDSALFYRYLVPLRREI